ncbi:hypothetical protein COY62_01055 [bacterium (Candidatus Howlettbacteria) CG_4_10_14_0_8_um_filter_40_9]|nr:MAG: hypothetical protein COY62_01055 [bacterium (Candidatus Howlettbacteria) CG_4_10_14_0_8_um_filter_40_9]
MPAKNVIKEYVKDGIYHVYNRGINKQNIFLDGRDYATFLFYLKLYLQDPEKLKDIDPQKRKSLVRKNFFGNIELLCYCLMPNHFHLLIKQKGERDIAEFMKSLGTNYSMYFNDRHDRIGTLFQGPYKAILVKNDSYLLHLSRYIHKNPEDLIKGENLDKLFEYEWSSYTDYLGKKETKWVKPRFILDYFDQNKDNSMIGSDSYQKFVEEYIHDTEKILEGITLE